MEPVAPPGEPHSLGSASPPTLRHWTYFKNLESLRVFRAILLRMGYTVVIDVDQPGLGEDDPIYLVFERVEQTGGSSRDASVRELRLLAAEVEADYDGFEEVSAP